MKDMLAENLALLLRGDKAAQASIAEKVGVTQPTISKWSNLAATGSQSEPEFRKIARLAVVLGVSLDDLAWRDLREPRSAPSHAAGLDDETVSQGVELLYLLADARPEDKRFERPSWAMIQVAAKAIQKAEGSQRDAMAELLAELKENPQWHSTP